MGLNLDFGTHKKSPFPLKRGVSSTEFTLTNTKIMRTFIRDKNLVSPEWGCSKGEVPLYYYELLKTFETKKKERSWVT